MDSNHQPSVLATGVTTHRTYRCSANCATRAWRECQCRGRRRRPKPSLPSNSTDTPVSDASGNTARPAESRRSARHGLSRADPMLLTSSGSAWSRTKNRLISDHQALCPLRLTTTRIRWATLPWFGCGRLHLLHERRSVPKIACYAAEPKWGGHDLNVRPRGYEPRELAGLLHLPSRLATLPDRPAACQGLMRYRPEKSIRCSRSSSPRPPRYSSTACLAPCQ